MQREVKHEVGDMPPVKTEDRWKKPYRRPRLAGYGKLRDLTAGNAGGKAHSGTTKR